MPPALVRKMHSHFTKNEHFIVIAKIPLTHKILQVLHGYFCTTQIASVLKCQKIKIIKKQFSCGFKMARLVEPVFLVFNGLINCLITDLVDSDQIVGGILRGETRLKKSPPLIFQPAQPRP